MTGYGNFRPFMRLYDCQRPSFEDLWLYIKTFVYCWGYMTASRDFCSNPMNFPALYKNNVQIFKKADPIHTNQPTKQPPLSTVWLHPLIHTYYIQTVNLQSLLLLPWAMTRKERRKKFYLYIIIRLVEWNSCKLQDLS